MPLQMAGHIGLRFLEESISSSVILATVMAFRETYPRVSFSIEAGDEAGIEIDLISGKLEFGVVHGVRNTDFIGTMAAGSTRQVAVASPDYAGKVKLERAEAVVLADVIDVSTAVPMVRLWMSGADASMLALADKVKPSLTVPSESLALEAALRGGGVAFLPESLVRDAVRDGKLVTLPSPTAADGGAAAVRPVVYAYRKKNTRPLVESVFLEFISDEASD